MESFSFKRKRLIIFSCIAGLLLLGSLAVVLSALRRHERPNATESSTCKTFSIPSAALECLQDGDILLQSGRSWLSTTIVRVINEPHAFSHVGMLIWEEGEWQVLHTLSSVISEQDGLRIEPIASFLNGTHLDGWLIVRLHGGNPQALVSAGKDYMRQKIPFDRMFDLADSSQFYCSEFIYHALRRAGYPNWQVDTFFNGKTYLHFDHLYHKNSATIIYDAKNRN